MVMEKLLGSEDILEMGISRLLSKKPKIKYTKCLKKIGGEK